MANQDDTLEHPQCEPEELHALVSSLHPIDGAEYREDIKATNERGRALIKRIAGWAECPGIPLPRLALTQVADILSYIGHSEPLEPGDWWQDPPEGPSHVVGFYALLRGLECSLRAHASGSRANSRSAPREAIEERLDAVRWRLWEIAGALKMVSRAAETEADQKPGFAHDTWNATAAAARAIGEIADHMLEPELIMKPLDEYERRLRAAASESAEVLS